MGRRNQGYLEKMEVKYLKIELVHVTVVIVLRLVPKMCGCLVHLQTNIRCESLQGYLQSWNSNILKSNCYSNCNSAKNVTNIHLFDGEVGFIGSDGKFDVFCLW